MRRPEQYAAEYASSHQKLLEAAFHHFSQHNIESVRLEEVAAEAGLSVRTLLRHFKGKDALVVETATWAFVSFMEENRRHSPRDGGTAAEAYAFFLNSFLNLYRHQRDLLRFNQFFNAYVQSRHLLPEQLEPYMGVAGELRERFHAVYEKGRQDGTLRTDAAEEEIFNTSLHLMMAAVTRYAVGLVYLEGADTERELAALREMLLERYTRQT